MGLNEKIFDYLEAVTLQQLVDSRSRQCTEAASLAMEKSIKPMGVLA